MAEPVTSQADAVAALTKAGQDGYDAFPRDCSHSIWVMLKLTGSPDEPYRTANELMWYMASQGSGWHRVLTVEDASKLANEGKVVLGGLAVPSGHGHVVMVMPGPPHASGGFDMGGGAMARSSGAFPPSASGASSSWLGARSRGEKTVRDPWSGTDWPKVTFWTRD